MKLAPVNVLGPLLQLAGLIILLMLTACCRTASMPYVREEPTLPCKVYGASDNAIIAMQAGLEKNGVKIITIGQDFLVSIPAKLLFFEQTPRLTWGSYALLNQVACYLKQFRKVAINITSFSSKYVSRRRELALTLTRSRAVGDYLWSQGVDSRFIFTEGLGSDKPIMSLSGGGDSSQNARVEITFRRAVA